MNAPILEVSHLSKSFAIRKGNWIKSEERMVPAVSDVSLTVNRGECVGLVGESGCGKTTVMRTIAGNHPPSREAAIMAAA